MADVALTNIKHGVADGEDLWVPGWSPDGEENLTPVPAGAKLAKLTDLPADVRKNLKAAGVIGPAPVSSTDAENAALAERDARIADLEAQLAAAKSDAGSGDKK